jgi:hypothetical protein
MPQKEPWWPLQKPKLATISGLSDIWKTHLPDLRIQCIHMPTSSCPSQNPIYLNPNQGLPTLDFQRNTTSAGAPGSLINFIFPDANNQPCFAVDKEYFAVFFHGINNITMPFDVNRRSSIIPDAFDTNAGLISPSYLPSPTRCLN